MLKLFDFCKSSKFHYTMFYYTLLLLFDFGHGQQSSNCRQKLAKGACLKHSLDRGTTYYGSLNVTKSGVDCVNWKYWRAARSSYTVLDDKSQGFQKFNLNFSSG